jgi:hypothetical protein
MKKRVSILVLSLMVILSLGSMQANAQQQVFAVDGEPTYEATIADTTSSVGFNTTYLTRTDPGSGRTVNAKSVLFIAQTATVTFTVTGTTPTIAAGTDAGIQMTAGQSWVLKGINAIKKFRCINTVASSGAKIKYIVFF